MNTLNELFEYLLSNTFKVIDIDHDGKDTIYLTQSYNNDQEIDIRYYLDDALDIYVEVTEGAERHFSVWIDPSIDHAETALLKRLLALSADLSKLVYTHQGKPQTSIIAQTAQQAVYRTCSVF